MSIDKINKNALGLFARFKADVGTQSAFREAVEKIKMPRTAHPDRSGADMKMVAETKSWGIVHAEIFCCWGISAQSASR